MVSKLQQIYRGRIRHAAILPGVVWLLLAGLLIGCTPIVAPTATPLPAPGDSVATPAATPAATPVASPTVVSTVAPPAENGIPERGEAPLEETGAAVVEKLDVRILESFPVQVHVVVSGYLPDGCTTIRSMEAVSAGTTFRIRMTTGRPANAMCTMAIVPFEEVVPLDVAEMPAGVYDVRVNDLRAEFELPSSGVEEQP